MFEYKFFYSEEKYIFYDRIKNKIENDEREDVNIKNHNLSNIYQVQEIMLKICCTYVENLHAMTENKNYVLIEI